MSTKIYCPTWLYQALLRSGSVIPALSHSPGKKNFLKHGATEEAAFLGESAPSFSVHSVAPR